MASIQELFGDLEGKRSRSAIEWAFIANGGNNMQDTFFPVSALSEHYDKLPWPSGFPLHPNDVSSGKKVDGKQIMPAVVAYLQKLGIKRMGLFAKGNFSPVFETVPDKEGRCQLVTLVGGLDEIIPHPLFIPKQHVGRIEAGDTIVHVIVSPAMRRKGVIPTQVKAVSLAFKDTGLEPKDFHSVRHGWRTANVVLYDTGVAGEDPIAFSPDIGAALWPKDATETDKKHWRNDWKTNPLFKRERAVHEKYDNKGLENISLFPTEPSSRTPLPLINETPDCQHECVIDRADKKGMTGYEYPELQKAGIAAMRAARDNNEGAEGWVRRMNEAVDKFDPTQNPNEPHGKR
jgi:hypothetical protein